MKNVKNDLGCRMLNIGDVSTILGVSIYSIKAALARGSFPEPVQVNLSKRWAVSTIRDFATGQWRPSNPLENLDEGEAA
ncbi:hypothetical protein [Methylocystis heyeri]|uniref:AlpA family phage regulatory protein n=1 Tax=Methylocystis heyeri TaxID=391905 RepID=A0A6B8KIW9_9HYPH|nr:hypothetical protein [Methylocystis heyeri]QGM46478.1 hypothetical protein H2LOC_012670 [Methylocystis heyeri]